jgi:hypothetical protein
MVGLEARANLASASWMQSNPELAEAWRVRLSQHDVSGRHTAEQADAASRHREVEEALADLEKWALRARVLGLVAAEAYERAMKAHARALSVDASANDIAQRLGGTSKVDLPALTVSRPAPAARAGSSRAAAGGGFLFYAESGIDADGDGDVDGGLLDHVTGEGSNDGDGISGLLGELFGS